MGGEAAAPCLPEGSRVGGGVPRDGGDCQWLAAPKMEGDLCFHLV